MAPAEPLFPPPASQADPQESEARNAEASLAEELRKARSEASTAVALLAATRKELAAVLDVERRTSQTLIDADRQVRDARSEVARMRLLLNSLAAAMGLAAAGLAWIEFQRAASRRRTPRESPAQEPALFTGLEQPA